MKTLDLDILREKKLALSERVSLYLMEAGTFCFSRAGHSSGVALQVRGLVEEAFLIKWENAITPEIERAWNETDEATEYGATAVALVLMDEILGLKAVTRERKGNRVDYLMGHISENGVPQIVAGLEISGIAEATKDNTVMKRIKLKKKRLDKTDFPVYIAVVEFGEPSAHLVKTG